MVEALFASVGLFPRGPVPWQMDIPEMRPGVYVIVSAGEVVYIGQTTGSLAKRLREFYRHQYGAKAPHRGGQDILQLRTPLSVYWAVTDDPRGAVVEMRRWLSRRFAHLPIGNHN